MTGDDEDLQLAPLPENDLPPPPPPPPPPPEEEDSEGEYELAEEPEMSPAEAEREEALSEHQQQVERRIDEELDRKRKRRFQFTIRDLLGVMTGLSIFMSMVMLVPGGTATEIVAGVVGMMVLVGMIVLEVVGDPPKSLKVGWWIGLTLYLIICLAAIIRAV